MKFFLPFILIFPLLCSAQEIQRMIRNGADGEDIGYGVTATASGDVYMVGYSDASGSFNLSQSQSGSSIRCVDHAIFLSRYSTDGTLQWVTQSGGIAQDYGYDLALFDSTRIIISGSFRETGIFGPDTIEAKGDNDAFVSAYDPSGNILWTTGLGGAGRDEAFAVVVLNGKIYISGIVSDSLNINGSAYLANSSGSPFLACLDDAGNLLWFKIIEGEGYAFDIQAVNNLIYISGGFRNSIKLDNNSYQTSGDRDGFIVSLDQSGSELWATVLSGPGYESIHALGVSGSQLLFSGDYYDGASFSGQQLVSKGYSDIVFGSFSNNVLQWSSTIGDKGVELSKDIISDSSGTVYLALDIFDSLKIQGDLVRYKGNGDIAILQFDSSGNYLRVSSPGSNSMERLEGLAIKDGKPSFCGTFSNVFYSSSDSIVSDGDSDAYLVFADNSLHASYQPVAPPCPGTFINVITTYKSPSLDFQLSDSNGYFFNPVTLIYSPAPNGYLVEIPGNTRYGDHYRIRAIDNGKNVLGSPGDEFSVHVHYSQGLQLDITCGDTVQTNLQVDISAGESYTWSPGIEISDSSSRNPFMAGITEIDYSVKITSNTGCITYAEVSKDILAADHDLEFTQDNQFLQAPPFIVNFVNLTPDSSEYDFIWLFGDGQISSATDPSHTYTSNGTYTVKLVSIEKTTGCTDTLTKQNWIFCINGPTGIDEINIDEVRNGLVVYSEISSIEIYDVTGRSVEFNLVSNSHGTEVILNEDESTGIYFYSFMINERIYSGKILKQ